MHTGLGERRVLVTGGSGAIGHAIAVAFGREGATVALTYRTSADGHVRSRERRPRPVPQRRSSCPSTSASPPRCERRWRPWSAISAAPSTSSSTTRSRGRTRRRMCGSRTPRSRRCARPSTPTSSAPTHSVRRSWAPCAVDTGVGSPTSPRGWPRTASPAPRRTPRPRRGSTVWRARCRRELAADGVLTNVVMAGFVPHGEIPPSLLEQGRRSAATGRLTTPEHVANVIVFLCSESNGAVTGEAVRVDGHFYPIAA